jgi:hypothetical protein
MESKNVEVLREAAMPFFEDGNISSMTKENLVKSLAPIRNFLDHAAGPNRSVLRAKLATMLDELEANTKLYETKNRDLFLRLVRQVRYARSCLCFLFGFLSFVLLTHSSIGRALCRTGRRIVENLNRARGSG